MWLVDRVADGDSVFLTECHPISRLMRSPAALAYLTPPGRVLIGVAFYQADLLIPSPEEISTRANEALSEVTLPRLDRWRWQRILRQLPRATERKTRWPEFVVRNRIWSAASSRVAVMLADQNRAVVDAEGGMPLSWSDAERFWVSSPFTPFGAAVAELSTAHRPVTGG